jgi:hypothetical protein
MPILDEIRAKRGEIHAVARRHKADKLWALGSCGYKEVSACDTFDYTEWRKNNLFQGETVDSLCDQIEHFQKSQS